MQTYIEERIYNVAGYILETHDTIRATAKKFGYSKSTIHNDVSYRLKSLDENLYQQTQKILEENFEVKHIRGGNATKNKYKPQTEENANF